MSHSGLLSTTGTVTIADRTFVIQKLSASGELSLFDALSAAAKKEAGPGGYLARASEMLDWLKKNNRGQELAIAVNKLVEMDAQGVNLSQDAVAQFRQTAKGVALEMFHRSRVAHKEVSLADFQAIITDANAVEVFLAMMEVLTDEKKAPTP